MTRYAASQLLLALALATIGTVKAARILLDQIDDTISNVAGLT